MISEADARRAEEWIEEAVGAGAQLLCGGKRAGSLLAPTVLAGTRPEQRVNCEESSRPVVTVEPYQDFEEAVRRVNDSPLTAAGGSVHARRQTALLFGQPEINIGVIPGAGGTQRLTRVVGKHKAMELILTGRPMLAKEAFELGLVNKLVPVELFMEEAKAMAKEIAKKSPVAVRLAKEAVLKTYDTSISEGLQFERKNFYMLFSSKIKKTGMKAFLEKRPASFRPS